MPNNTPNGVLPPTITPPPGGGCRKVGVGGHNNGLKGIGQALTIRHGIRGRSNGRRSQS